ncbi:conserved hypothetical protein [Vibrio chagasii]|nr:conserved hypothetical protein [Vibrio chagasii]CAH7315394.1 conserved hypothetical protein [Vibrio chagasii]
MLENVVVGLVSGLFVSFLVLVIGRFWKGVVEPWFEERVYKDLQIEGKWYSLYVETGDYRQEIVNLKRHGHTITGNMTCKNGADDGEEYILCGSFRNLVLPLTYESADKTKSDRGTITLMSSHNGQRFIGEVAMYETKSDAIDTAHVMWFRNKEDIKSTVEYIQEHREELRAIRNKEREIREELSDFMEEFAKAYAKKKRKEKAEKEDVIEGEAHQIEHKEG